MSLIVNFVEKIADFPFYNEVVLKINQSHTNYDSLSDDEQKVEFTRRGISNSLCF